MSYGLLHLVNGCEFNRSMQKTAFGRSPPVLTTACAGQVECKRLVSTNAIDWSVTMQMVKSMHLRRLTLKPDERPPGHGKPPISKVFQR